jgi:hypothetical protein
MKPVLNKICELLYIVLKADVMELGDLIGFISILNDLLVAEEELMTKKEQVGDLIHRHLSECILDGQPFSDPPRSTPIIELISTSAKEDENIRQPLKELIKNLCYGDCKYTLITLTQTVEKSRRFINENQEKGNCLVQ